MKYSIPYKLVIAPGRRAIRLAGFVAALLLTGSAWAQDKQPGLLEMVSRQPQPVVQQGMVCSNGNGGYISITKVTGHDDYLYGVSGAGMDVKVPALSNIEIPVRSGNIWVYGDSAYRHSVGDVYANVYSRSGTLINSLGWLGTRPFAADISEHGAFVFAGNTARSGKPDYRLLLFDENGEQRLSVALPNMRPTDVVVAEDHKHVAVVGFVGRELILQAQIFDEKGTLVHTVSGSPSGVAFLPGNKMVVCYDRSWQLFDMAWGFNQLFTGALPGSTVGRFPIASDAAGNQFFILTRDAVAGQLSLQAYETATGSKLAQAAFPGAGHRLPYKQLEYLPQDLLLVRLDSTILSLKMK